MSLCNYKYAMVLKFNDVFVGHVPKFLSKICYFYQKHGGTIIVRITGERQYSKDLVQGGMEFPVKYIFRLTDENMNSKLPTLIGNLMQEYQKSVKEEKKKTGKERKTGKKEKQIEKKSDTRK